MILNNFNHNSFELDETDIHILNELQVDCRKQYRALAKETGKALGTIANRIQKLDENGIIESWSVRVNSEKVGFDLTCAINIQIDVKELDHINNELKKIPELVAIYNVTGDYDVLAIGRFIDRRHLDKTIHRIININHIQKTSSHVMLRTLKEDFRVYFP